MHRVFVTIGQVSEDGVFRKYPSKHGELHERRAKVIDCGDGESTLGDILAELSITTRKKWSTVCEYGDSDEYSDE